MNSKKIILMSVILSCFASQLFAGVSMKTEDTLPSLVMTDLSFMPTPRRTPEDYLVFEYQAHNIGRSEAAGVMMTNQPRNGLIYISHQCPSGWTSQAYRSDDGSVVATCEGGVIPAAGNARMEITLKNPLECMGSPYTPLSNKASVYSRSVEMDYSDNEVESLFYLLACPK